MTATTTESGERTDAENHAADRRAEPSPADAAHHAPRVRTAIAVLLTRFPRLEETFILREIVELERHGQPVLIVPLLRSGETVIDDEARPWIDRALFTPFFSAAILRSNLLVLFRRPLAYLGLLLRLMVITIVRPSTMLRTLAFFPKAVHLSVILPQRGIRHVHAHFASHATTVAYVIASLSRITYSFTVHGPDVFVHRVLLRRKIAGAKFIRCISLFNKAFLCGLYPALTEGKTAVVHSGVHPEPYEQAAARSRHRHSRLRLLSVAALTRSRGFPLLIDACARLEKRGLDFECDIAGDGPMRGAIERAIARRNLDSRVRILGALPQHELARLMGAADVFVLPSIIARDGQMDGIPIALMEAMAAGKPVIASLVSGIPELVQHGVSGMLVDAAYPGRIADAVQFLAGDAALRARLGHAGQAKVCGEFDVHRNAAALVSLFDRQRRANEAPRAIGDRIGSLPWDRLGVQAVGVRRVHHHSDMFLAEVQISDGVLRKDVIVRRPHGEDAVARVRAEHDVLTMLHRRMGSDAAHTVPGVLMYDEPHAALVLERADGRALASCMSETNLARAGAWLRTLHDCTSGEKDAEEVLSQALAHAHCDLDRAAAADRRVRRHNHEIRDELRRLEASVASRPRLVVGQHGHFRPQNVFLSDEQVWAIDFAAWRNGLAEEDVAQMLLFVDRPELRRAFLDGYGGSIDPDALQLFTITKALALLSRTEAGWRERRKLHRAIGGGIEN